MRLFWCARLHLLTVVQRRMRHGLRVIIWNNHVLVELTIIKRCQLDLGESKGNKNMIVPYPGIQPLFGNDCARLRMAPKPCRKRI